MKKQRAEYDAWVERREEEKGQEEEKVENEEKERFIALQEGRVPTSSSSSTKKKRKMSELVGGSGGDVLLEGDDEEEEVGKESTSRLLERDVTKGREDLGRVSHWLPMFTPDMEEKRGMIEPPKRPPSPFSSSPLRAKDLVSVNLEREEDKVLCALSKKPISTQDAVLFKQFYNFLDSFFVM